MRSNRGARMLLAIWALGMLPLASLVTQSPVSAATLTLGKVEKIGAPRSVVFGGSNPPPRPSGARGAGDVAHDSLPFHPRSAIAFAAAKQAAETGGAGRSTGVVPLSPATASPSSRAPLTTTGGGGSLQIVNAFPLTDRNGQIGWFPGPSQAVTPPDTQIAVGDMQFMEMINDSGSIWDKATGAHVAHVSLYSFFVDPSRPASAGVTDPRVFYDSAIQRWFASVLGFTNAGDSWVYLARSDTSDPGGAWHVYTVSHRTAALQDQPKLGVTSDKVIMTWNDFNTSNLFTGSETVVIQKSEVGTPSQPAAIWMTNGADPSRFNLIPVQGPTLTPASYLAYNIYDNSPNPKSLGRMGLISIAGTPVGGNLTAVEQDLSIAPTSMPPGAEQSPGSPRLATNDDSFTSAAFSNGILWVAGTDGCFPAESTLRSCLRVIQLSLVGTPAIIQDVDLGQNGGHLFFPAVALDASGNMTAVYTASSVSTPASVATTGQAAATIGTWERGWVIATGVGPYDCGMCSTGFNGVRWGDYSAAVVDPTSGDVWVAGEYAPSLTDKTDWGTGAAHMAMTPSVLKTATSTAQYQLTSSDGSTWVPIDPSHLSLTITPATTGTAILDANVDLWTANAGINQDIGIFVKAGTGPDALVAWKESGGFAGTFSPNAAFVHHVMSVTANVQYTVSLRWKANRPATGASIFAGAGPIGGAFSPTRVTARLVESGSIAITKVSTNQYIRSSGANWTDMDSAVLALDIPATPNTTAVISANADLWTVKPGFNQDLGIAVGGNVVAWKESGGFAGTFSPNAAFVQTIVDASSAFHVSLKWKTNTSAAGGEIRAGAGQSPFSPTRLTVELVPTWMVRTAVSTPDKQYQLTGSDGTSWVQPDPVLLHLSVTPPSTDCLALVSVNVDLWTATAGVNQDIAIAVSGGGVVQTPVTHWPAVVAWKESGGNAGTFSPNAAFLQTVIQFSNNNGPYDLTVQWKSNIPTGGQIRAGAGLSPNFSPTRLTAQLICS